MSSLSLSTLPIDLLKDAKLIECYKNAGKFVLLFEQDRNYILFCSGKDNSVFSVYSYAVEIFNRRVKELKQEMKGNVL